MNWRKTILDYNKKFNESAGCPFDGFPDDKTEREYFEMLQICVETGKPLTPEQRKRFFPSEHQDIPADTYI